MPRRPLADVGVELSGRIAAIEIALAQLFEVDVDRKKRIDGAIDYFGAGPVDVAREDVRQLGPARTEISPSLRSSGQTSELISLRGGAWRCGGRKWKAKLFVL
jgi:hypothetical protein